MSLFSILILSGAEGMRVIFRNNFGKHGINLTRLVICSFCFALISYFSFKGESFGLDIDDSPGTANSFFITGIIYALLSALILIKGIICKINARQKYPDSDYHGDSTLLGFLANYSLRQNIIQNLAEPLYTLIMGVLFWLYNPVGGIPLIICALSLWANILFDLLFGNHAIPVMQNEIRSNQQQDVFTNQVSAD